MSPERMLHDSRAARRKCRIPHCRCYSWPETHGAGAAYSARRANRAREERAWRGEALKQIRFRASIPSPAH